jgi:hypothetical protein
MKLGQSSSGSYQVKIADSYIFHGQTLLALTFAFILKKINLLHTLRWMEGYLEAGFLAFGAQEDSVPLSTS